MARPRSDPSASPRTAAADVPLPLLTLSSPIGVITDVRFVWPHHCRWCGNSPELFSDGGRIESGLAMRSMGAGQPQLMQWTTRYLPAGAPVIPADCPQPQCRHPRMRKRRSGPVAPYQWLTPPDSITTDPVLADGADARARPEPAHIQIPAMLAQIRAYVRRCEPTLALQADELLAVRQAVMRASR